MMLGGIGILIGVILFLLWRKSTKAWQRVIAWMGVTWAGSSFLFYWLAFYTLTTTYTPTPTLPHPTATIIRLTRIKVRTPTPDVFITGWVRESRINVRSGPGTQYNIVGKLPAHTRVTVKARNQDSSWGWVVSDNATGWVKLSVLYFKDDVIQLPIMLAGDQQSIITKAADYLVTPTARITPTPIPTKIIPTAEILACGNTWNQIGDLVICKIQRAYCSYQPATDGSPTFCNDRPYPNHNFTLLVWDDDWSDYDGECIIVRGYVSLYRGKPQIEASSRSQISYCQ